MRILNPSIGLVPLFALVSLSVLSGCGLIVAMGTQYEKKVPKNDKRWGGFVCGATYALKMDVFLTRASDWSDRMILLPPTNAENLGTRHYGAPATAEGRRDEWPDGYGIVKAGTRLKAEYLIEHGAVNVRGTLHVFMRVLDGTHKDKIVDVSDLSKLTSTLTESGPYLHEPDTRIVAIEHSP